MLCINVSYVCFSVVSQAVCICRLYRGVYLCTFHRADLSLLYPGTVRRPSLIPVRGLPEHPAGHHRLLLVTAETGAMGILLCPLCGGELLRWVEQFRAHTAH